MRLKQIIPGLLLGIAVFPHTQGLVQSPSDVFVIIDAPDNDHSVRRETTITRLSGRNETPIRYHIVRKFFPEDSMHFNDTEGNMTAPPIVQNDLVIYPGRYSRLLGNDTSNVGGAARILSFSDAVETVVQGELLEDILGEELATSRTDVDKIITVVPKARTGAFLGMTATVVAEHELNVRENAAGYSNWLVDLGNGKKGFVGTRVDAVASGGPAAKAGILPGDLILSIDSHRTNKDRKLESIIDYSRPGATLQCALIRSKSGKINLMTIPVVPEARSQK